MKTITVTREKNKAVVASPCWVADSFFERFMGLMGKSALEPGQGILLSPCNSVHTFFMRFAIDVVYLDHEGKILSVARAMKPWRVGLPVFGASAVLELAAGHASDLSEGELLCLS